MSEDAIEFYVRHRDQISAWAAVHRRVDQLMREAFAKNSPDLAMKILTAESGDAEVDFYVRNRALIIEWDALQILAGKALHEALLTAAAAAGYGVDEGKNGWITVYVRTAELDELREKQRAWVEMAWMKQGLLSTRRGFPFPRIAVTLPPSQWGGENRAVVIGATSIVANELGMKRRGDAWWAHWGVLDAISKSEDLQSYAERCVLRLREVSEHMHPPLQEAIDAAASPPRTLPA